MQILTTTWPAQGLVNPMLPIARAGYDMTIATDPDLAELGYSALYPAAGEQPPEVLAELPYPQTIHLTLGADFSEAPGVLETAIEALCELPFNLVVTSGPGTDPARFGPQPPHVLVEPCVPHTLLLPHCCLVVSHGGADIMFSALAHGLPQLILPQWGDQFWNADVCQRMGAGLALAPEACSADAVAEAAYRLITDPTFTMAARRIQTLVIAAPPGCLSLLPGSRAVAGERPPTV